LVLFEWGPDAKQRVIEAAEALGARVAEYWPSGHVLELWVARESLLALAAHDDVQWVDRWTPAEQDMDLVREDSGANRVENEFGYCGQGVRGEVLDGGIQDDHPDFDGITLHGPHDVDSHGTSTYGIVFGNGDTDGDGDGRAIGQLPCGQGIFADYTELTDRFAHTDELTQSPYFASFQSNSWGGGLTTSYTSASQEMDDIIWRLDFAILNSQSNTGNRSSRPQAWAKNVISVGGIYHYDTLDSSDDAWAGGASIGPAADGRIKPDVSYWFDSIFTTTTGGSYTSGFGGTSAATPEAAGTLGLLLEMWADNVWETDPPGATVFERKPHFATLKALLINNSQQYDFVSSAADLSRFKQGWGRPSAHVAYERATTSFVVDQDRILELNDVAAYAIDVPPGETELKVTLAYPDPPGTTSASLHRINDVDLRVTSPSAALYLGNVGLEDGTESTTGGSADDLNTVENVFVTNPEAGIWTVEVEAVEVNLDAHLGTPADDVAFGLVVTGGSAVTTSGAGSLRVTPSKIACDQPLSFRVRDGNVGAASVDVAVASETETAPETVTLVETNPGSGNYTGQIPTTTTLPAVDDSLSVADGDTITVEYVDADDGAGGSNVTLQDTATTDCSAPAISNVMTVEITDTEAAISWITDEAADSSLSWGTTLPPGQIEERSGHATTHSLRLRGLAECTTYFYSVSSSDPVGNTATDDNAGAYYLFTTLTRTDGELHSCRDGTLVIEADVVGCSADVPLRLTDLDLDTDPGVAETVQVFVTSSTDTEPEVVVLTEDGPATGVFTGSIPTGTGAAVGGDGILQSVDGDLVTSRYEDLDNGSGGSETSTYTITTDCAAPEIQPVTVGGITDAEATVSWITSEPTTGYVEWGTTPALGAVVTSDTLKSSHFVTIGNFPACGRVYFRVVATDLYGNTGTAEAAGSPFEFNAWGVPGILYLDDFETDAGWTLDGEWEIGQPQGLGTAPGDPIVAFSGTQVLGHDLAGQGTQPGDYEPNSSENAVGPVIDASSFSNTELIIRRWLNVVNGSFAYVDVKNASGSWQNVWTTSIPGVTDSQWTETVLDISAHADGNADLQIRFRERSFLDTSFDAGWNVDDLVLRDGSLPALDSCGGCAGAPTFAGLIAATDDDPCADSGVTLTWAAAPAWGTGTTGSYAVYRDTQAGFTPGPDNLVASGIAGPTWTDTLAPDDVDLHYVVRAENDETCGGGPANGGVTESNLVYAVERDATSQAAPGDVGDTLRVDEVNGAHARLTWAATAGATEYRIYRAAVPDATFDLHANDPATFYEDRDVLGDGQDWYYLVVAADACGNEGP
jgi:hypothetical protein